VPTAPQGGRVTFINFSELAAMNFEQLGDDLTADENKHWREVAEYDRYTKPLLVRLRAVEWPALLALHSARWHREAVEAIRARTPMYDYCSSALSHQELIKESKKRKPSSYGWLGSYHNIQTGKYRQIQRYPLLYLHDTGTYPVRFCPPEGQPLIWGFWFRTSDVKSTSWTPEAHTWQSYEKAKELYRQVLRDIDAEKRNSPNRRQYLADCLRSSSQRLGRYSTQHFGGAGGFFTKETYELNGNLDKAMGGNSRPSYLGALSSDEFGEIEAKWEHFQRCLREFYEAEKAAPVAVIAMTAQPTSPAKGTPAADVLYYFPDVAAIPGTTEANALQQFAEWLLLWAERHGCEPACEKYSLAGRMHQQQATHTNTGKFLKACRRLHETLLPLAAKEQSVKQLLGDTYGPHSRTNLAAVLKWWVGWLKEQRLSLDDPAGAYLAALRRVPIIEEWENDSPRYNIPSHLWGPDEFSAEMAPLRQAFETALPDLSTKKKRALRAGLNELLGIDRARVQRHREQFERGEYGLNFLPADYLALRFDVAGQLGNFKWQWVNPQFWGWLSTLLQFKQMAARTAFEKLNVALGETLPAPELPKPGPASDTPAEDSCYCRTHPNAETLADLPASCRIHEVIREALPEIEKQIAARKLADSPAVFRAYCEEKLAHHVKNVGDMTKNLAHPTLYSEAERPQMLELKLWNLTLCGLYKSELATSNTAKSSLPADILNLDGLANTVGRTSASNQFNPFPFGAAFTELNADHVAREIKLIDEFGSFIAKPGRNGRDGKRAAKLAGFYLTLLEKRLVRGTHDELRDYFAHRYLKEKITTSPSTTPNAAQDVARDTEKALKTLFPALFQSKIKA
jgi:hypothetical protein